MLNKGEEGQKEGGAVYRRQKLEGVGSGVYVLAEVSGGLDFSVRGGSKGKRRQGMWGTVVSPCLGRVSEDGGKGGGVSVSQGVALG